MAKALDMIVDNEFQSEHDKDEVKTTFMIRSLSGLEFIECTSKGYVDHSKVINLGLTGWKNFPDSAGVEIEFNMVNINRIPALILQDISYEIQEISSIQGDERKNS